MLTLILLQEGCAALLAASILLEEDITSIRLRADAHDAPSDKPDDAKPGSATVEMLRQHAEQVSAARHSIAFSEAVTARVQHEALARAYAANQSLVTTQTELARALGRNAQLEEHVAEMKTALAAMTTVSSGAERVAMPAAAAQCGTCEALQSRVALLSRALSQRDAEASAPRAPAACVHCESAKRAYAGAPSRAAL
jgi:hypothetical protein